MEVNFFIFFSNWPQFWVSLGSLLAAAVLESALFWTLKVNLVETEHRDGRTFTNF